MVQKCITSAAIGTHTTRLRRTTTSAPSYRKKTTSCTIHFIRTEIVRDLILDALRNVATYVRDNKEDFEQLVMQTTSDARRRSLQSGRTELDRIMRRTNELDTLLQKLYEDYALGRLPEKRHAKLSAQTAAAIALPFSKVEELTGKPLCKSGVQVRFLLVSGAGQTAFQYHLQRRI